MLIKRDVGVAVKSWNSRNINIVETYEITTSSNHGAFAIAADVAVFARTNQPNLSDCASSCCCALGYCFGMDTNGVRCKRAAYY